MADNVNHPKHYAFSKIEVIDAIEAWELGFHLGNALKYIARAAHKGRMLEDLKKARWYLDRVISNLSSGENAALTPPPPPPPPTVEPPLRWAESAPQPGDDELLGYWILPSKEYPSWWAWGFGPEELWREAGADPQGFDRKPSRELALLACAAHCKPDLVYRDPVEVSSPGSVAVFGTVKNG